MGALSNKRVALLGCGRIATKRHAPVLSSGEDLGMQLAAVCDIDEAKAQALGSKYGVPWYTDGDAMMEKENPDILSILTPSGMHFEHAMHFLKYRKPLVVEKPVSLVLQDAQVLYLAAGMAGVPVFTVLQNRFNPPIQYLHQALREGRFGKIVSASVCVRWSRKEEYYSDWHGTWAQAGGVLANQAIHHIDLLTWFLGVPEEVCAMKTHTRSGEVEDTLVGIAKFPIGELASIEVTAAAGKDTEGSISIVGTKGTAKVGGFSANKMECWQFEEPFPKDQEIRESSESPPNVYGYGHSMFYDHVRTCLEYGLRDSINGIPSLRTVTALYVSAECGGRPIPPMAPGLRSDRLGTGGKHD